MAELLCSLVLVEPPAMVLRALSSGIMAPTGTVPMVWLWAVAPVGPLVLTWDDPWLQQSTLT